MNTKNNPRRVKKPVIKEWCYRPKDLLENPESFPADVISMLEAQQAQQDAAGDEGAEADAAGTEEETPAQPQRFFFQK